MPILAWNVIVLNVKECAGYNSDFKDSKVNYFKIRGNYLSMAETLIAIWVF